MNRMLGRFSVILVIFVLMNCEKGIFQSEGDIPHSISTPSNIYVADTITISSPLALRNGLQFEWTANGGSIIGDGGEVRWLTPTKPGEYTILCRIAEGDDFLESHQTTVEVQIPFSWEDLICFIPFRDFAKDESPNALHGQMIGASMSTDRFGRENNAAAFDGVNDYIDLGNSDYLKPNFPMTIMAWVRLDETTNQQFFTSNFDHDVYNGIWFSTNFESKLIINYGNGGATTAQGRRTRRGTTPLAQDVWYHVAAVLKNAQNMSVYLNGENDDNDYTGTATNLQYSDGSADIGRKDGSYNDPPLFLDGSIDDVIFWGRALTDAEIRMIYRYSLRHELTE